MADETHEHDEQADAELATPAEPEGEPAGDEADDQAELDEQPEPAEPAEPPSSTALAQALDREATRHEKALAKALGLGVEDLHACPTCLGVGYTPEPVEAETDVPQDPFLQRCERCDGAGAVRTGARAQAMYEVPCPGCSGQGYVQKAEHPEAHVTIGNGAPDYAPPLPSPNVAPGDADAVADLRRRGYTVVEPIEVPEPVAT